VAFLSQASCAAILWLCGKRATSFRICEIGAGVLRIVSGMGDDCAVSLVLTLPLRHGCTFLEIDSFVTDVWLSGNRKNGSVGHGAQGLAARDEPRDWDLTRENATKEAKIRSMQTLLRWKLISQNDDRSEDEGTQISLPAEGERRGNVKSAKQTQS
jgi:hypothetical protein